MCYIVSVPLGPVPDPTWWECVAQHRLRADLSKAKLADACGISRITLWRIETGKYEATPDQVKAIETALKKAAKKRA